MTTGTDEGAALTILTEEETMFRDAVAAFAEEEVRPRVHAMDKAAKLDPDLIPRFFELGLMGIEVPEDLGVDHDRRAEHVGQLSAAAIRHRRPARSISVSPNG